MNEDKFSGKADNYAKYRPSYPAAVIDWLYDKTHADTVADIGAGTGKFTQCLTVKPWEIIAVEPNPDMLEKLKSFVPGIKHVQASAESTGLADNSISLITTAQAFHWFNRYKFKEECKRILTENGQLAIIWNVHGKSGFRSERDRIFEKYCGMSDSTKISASKKTDSSEFLRDVYFSKMEFCQWDNPMDMDENGFIGYSLSHSYSIKSDHPNYENFVFELRNAFHKFSKNGIVQMPQYTVCYLGKF